MFNRLKKENLEVNQELNKELQENKQEEINFLNNIVREMLNLQGINSLGLAEEDKNKHRNTIINALVESCLEKINELSNKFGSDR